MKRICLYLMMALTLFEYSCLKNPDFEQLSSNFVTVTNTDSVANFAGFNTYYISDSVAYIGNSATISDSIIKDANTQKLVDAVKQNMNARGYTFVNKGAKPDLGLIMAILKNTSVYVVYSGWWDYWPGWWDPWYWGWYYPYYYPWSYAYTVTTGTVIVSMVDLKNASSEGVLRVVWNAFLGGAVGNNTSTNFQRGVDAINQAFAQSPSVKRN